MSSFPLKIEAYHQAAGSAGMAVWCSDVVSHDDDGITSCGFARAELDHPAAVHPRCATAFLMTHPGSLEAAQLAAGRATRSGRLPLRACPRFCCLTITTGRPHNGGVFPARGIDERRSS